MYIETVYVILLNILDNSYKSINGICLYTLFV